MAQVDKLNYFPNLFWFIILFVFTYFIIFSYILPFLYSSLKTRNLFYNKLLNNIKNIHTNSLVLKLLYKIPYLNKYIFKVKYLYRLKNSFVIQEAFKKFENEGKQ